MSVAFLPIDNIGDSDAVIVLNDIVRLQVRITINQVVHFDYDIDERLGEACELCSCRRIAKDERLKIVRIGGYD